MLIVLYLGSCVQLPTKTLPSEVQIYDSILKEASEYVHRPLAITTFIDQENVQFSLDFRAISEKYQIQNPYFSIGSVEETDFYKTGLKQSIEKNNVPVDMKSRFWIYLIGYNIDRTIALVYEYNDFLPRAGYGQYIVFQLRSGTWTRIAMELQWIS